MELISYDQVVGGSPIPNAQINPSVNTAGEYNALTNPTGQLDNMYKFSGLMSILPAALAPIELTTARLTAKLQDAIDGNCFINIEQTLNYIMDVRYSGFTVPSTYIRFLENSISKMCAFMPEILAFHQLSVEAIQSVASQVSALSLKIRNVGSDGKDRTPEMVKQSLLFRDKSLFDTATHSLYSLQVGWYLGGVMNGVLSLCPEGMARSTSYLQWQEYVNQLNLQYSSVPDPTAHIWNHALSVLHGVRSGLPSYVLDRPNQNLNAVKTIFSKTVDSYMGYEEVVLAEFKRRTDQSTPNWLDNNFAFQPIAVSAVAYTPLIVQAKLEKLKLFVGFGAQ